MAKAVHPIPEQYRGAIPYLCIKDTARALDFYKQAFGTRETLRMPTPDGRVMHAEIHIGDAVVMLGEECLHMDFRSPETIGGSPVNIYIYVNDVDGLAAKAEAAGITVTRPVQNQFYGDRTVQFRDPFGHIWGFATHIEDVPEDELKRRFEAMCASHAPA